MIVPVGFALMMIQFLIRMIENIVKALRHESETEVRAS
jgi:TRAP-type C4-dicarboxylate transport system permease small subunit